MININEISNNLVQRNDIWYSEKKQLITYPLDGNNVCFQSEESSFWFNHRNKIITSGITGFPPGGFIVDIGGGNGFVSKAIESIGIETVLLEPGIDGITNAKERGLKNLICSTFQDASLIQNSIPAVGLFDVLEHIEEDKLFIQNIYSVLKPDGKIYITVPAYSFLWSDTDEDDHFRRYNLNTIESVLRDAGFTVEYKTYFFVSLLPPVFLLKALPYAFDLRKKKAISEYSKDHKKGKGISQKVFDFLLNKEVTAIKNRKKFPFGCSCFIIGKKEQS